MKLKYFVNNDKKNDIIHIIQDIKPDLSIEEIENIKVNLMFSNELDSRYKVDTGIIKEDGIYLEFHFNVTHNIFSII